MQFLKNMVFVALVWAGMATGQELKVKTTADVRAAYEADQIGAAPLPDILRKAFYAAEDKQLYDRFLLRSTMLANFSRMMFYTKDATPLSAAEQYNNAVLVADALTTDEFLNWYVQKVHLGLGCDGVQDAAMAYFGKSLADLTLEDAAYLAALQKAPYSFHPVRDKGRAIEWRNFVIREMRDAELIDPARAETAMQADLAVQNPLGSCRN